MIAYWLSFGTAAGFALAALVIAIRNGALREENERLLASRASLNLALSTAIREKLEDRRRLEAAVAELRKELDDVETEITEAAASDPTVAVARFKRLLLRKPAEG